jgi:iron complex outermembrane receptor protein
MSNRRSLLSCAIGSVLGFSAEAAAQDRASALEEIIVTAERRAESLLEVPLSISAYSDQARETLGILSIQDMANFAPGVSFNMATDRPSIRGIARQSNFFTLDSPVANYFDGVYTSSVQDAQRRPIFIERTEILRGPQGALSGRGSIAGAFNTISKRPTDTFQTEVGTFYGKYERYGAEATISGPLVEEHLRARVNVGVYRQDEGYFKNVASGKTEGDQPNNRNVFDLLLDGRVGPVEYFFKAAYADYDETRRTGNGYAPFYAGDQLNPSAYGPSSNTLTPLAGWGYFDSIDGRLGSATNNPVILTGDLRKFSNDFHSRQKLDNHHNYTMHLTWNTGPVEIKWIGGHQNYRYTQWTDGDLTDVQQMQLPAPSTFPPGVPGRVVSPGSINLYMEDREWYSNELTFTSTTDGPFSWILGLYQSNEDFNQEPATTIFPGYDELNAPIGTVDTLLAILGLPPCAPPALQTNCFNPSGIRPVVPNPRPNTSVVGLIDGRTVSSAAFGQVAYEFSDRWKFTIGLRYNKDEKEATESLRYIANGLGNALGPWLAGGGLGTPRSVDVTPVPTGAPLQRGVIRDRGIDPVTGYRVRDFKEDWQALTGSVGIDFKPTSNDLFYVRAARGYRPGGFNAGFLYENPTVDEELVNSYEVGYKGTLFDRLQLTVSGFYYDYEDIQLPLPALGRCTDPDDLSTCTVLDTFTNLATGESKGVEIEANWAVTDALSLFLSYGYLDARIKNGLGANNGFQNPDDPAAVLPNAKRTEPIPGQFDSNFTYLPRWKQDLSGNKLANSPEHRVAFNANYTFTFDPGNLILSGSYVWRDEQYSDVFETEPAKVPSFYTVGLRALWVDAKDRYTIILYGSNLTDEIAPDSATVVRQRTGLATVGAPSADGQAYYKTLNLTPPREYGIELQYRFGR